MKKYYIKYYADFANTYNLGYAETPEEEAHAEQNGWERITRREAERKCAAENQRRKTDEMFSGYASNLIFPVTWTNDDYWRNERNLYQDGYVVCRIKP